MKTDKTKTLQRKIEVCAHWSGLSKPALMGILYFAPSRGKEIVSFEYHKEWLLSPRAQILDPSLRLYTGRQYATENQHNFGIFLDSSPDRWGRILMKKREEQIARKEKREPRELLESDYLLGVFDAHRMGGLRFRADPNGPFLDDQRSYASPPWTSLRELEYASLALEKDHSEGDTNSSKWLEILVVPGSSLGGARPKASVIDEHKALWIAKFPSSNDKTDIGAWEEVVNKLAKSAGVNVAEAHSRNFGGHHRTFLTKRFDRNESGERLHFASAMTLLQRTDGDDASQGVSYLELVEFLIQRGSNTPKDLEELWRRIVFFICVSNTDDHLRNHGFLLESNGWRLAPAYDINPVPFGEGLKLNISEADNSQDLELAKSVAKYFRLKKDKTDKIIREVVNVVKTWRTIAHSLSISKTEQDQMAAAFRIAEKEN